MPFPAMFLLGLTVWVSPAARADAPRARIAHHRLDARLDPQMARLTARDEATFRIPPGADPRADIHLLLARELEVDSVAIPLPGASWQALPSADPGYFAAEPDSLDRVALERAQEILLSPPSGRGWPDSFRVEFRYAGTVYDSLKAPVTPYERSFPTSDGLIDTAGVYLAGSSLWVPGDLDHAFTFELTADIPAAWHSMSEGTLADSTVSDGRRRETWISPEPMEEIYLIAGPYGIERAEAAGVEMLTYLYHPEPELSAKYLAATRHAIEKYSRLIGPYPFKKFALVENFWQTGFGMPSFTLLGDRVLRLPFIVDTSYPHEILHNWWGNGVFVDAHRGNWCEGLTVYGADYLSKEESSAAEARDYRRAILIDYRNYVRGRTDFPLEKFTGRSDPVTQNVGYGKGMMVFHMLRRELGDDLFWSALRRFYHQNLFHACGWREVFDAFQEESDRDLGGFYREWIERPGAPAITLEGAKTDRSGGAYRTTFTLRQQAPAYELEIPVVLRGDAAETTLVVPFAGESRTLTLATAWAPRSLSVDPDFQCFRQVDRGEIPATLSQTLGADSTLAIVSASAPESLRRAFEKVVATLSGGPSKIRVAAEGEVGAAELRHHAAWILGEGHLEQELMQLAAADMRGGATIARDRWRFGSDDFDPAKHSLVLTVPSPGEPELAWTFILAPDAEAAASLGPKLQHYGKYSYLVFEGGKNVAKGTLDPAASPMEARFP